MRKTCSSMDGERGTRRRPGRRWLWPVAAALAALGVVAAGAQPEAAASVTPMTAFFVGGDGGLYSFGRNVDGAWSRAALDGAAGLAPAGAPVAATRLTTGASVAALVGGDGAVYTECPGNGSAPLRIAKAGSALPGSALGLGQAGSATVIAIANPVKAPGGLSVLEVINPCIPSTAVAIFGGGSGAASLATVVPMSPTLPLPPPGAELAVAGLADGEFGVFFVDETGAVQALWYSAAGVWSASQLTASGLSTPGAGIAVTPTSGADPQSTSTVLSLAFTGRDGSIYLAHPLPGGRQSGAPLQLPTTAATRAPAGAALSVAGSSSGVVVGYAATSGSVSVAAVDAAGRALAPVALTASGFAAPGSSVASGSSSDEDDFVCGTPTGQPVHIRFPVGGAGPGVVVPAGPAGLTGSETVFSAS
jgi:hypothetical protein